MSVGLQPVQKYVIVGLLQPLAVGTEFMPEYYPLHVTIVPSFQLKTIDQHTIEELMKLCAAYPLLALTALNDEYFGSHKEVLVSPFEKNETIQDLHQAILRILQTAGATIDEPEYIDVNYRPHTTVQDNERIYAGDKVLIDSLVIIDKLPGGNPTMRKIIKVMPLATR